MAIFRSGKSKSLQQILRTIQAHEYTMSRELDQMLEEVAAHPDLSARSIVFMLSDSSSKIREFGATHVTKLAGKGLLELLLDSMRGSEPRARREIASLAAACAKTELFARLPQLIHSKLEDERLIGLEIISARKDCFEFLSFLKAALKDSKNELRRRALRILRRDGKNPTIRLILIELVHDSDDGVRREAISALAQEAAPDLVEPFFARLPEESREIQGLMVDALAKLANSAEAKLEERLIPILASEDKQLREIAVRLLASMPDRTRVLRSYLIQSRGLATWLRERTHKSILQLAEGLIEPLIELMADQDDDVRVGAMVMAKASKDSRLAQAIHKIFMSKSDWWIRSIAAESLAIFRSPQVTKALLSQLEDPDLRYSIITLLGDILDPQTVPVLLSCLRDPARGIRLIALEALRKTHAVLQDHPLVEETANAILELAKNDAQRTVREKASDVLTAFGPLSEPRLQEIAKHEEEGLELSKLAITSELSMANDSLND